jgi:hypothetical protein
MFFMIIIANDYVMMLMEVSSADYNIQPTIIASLIPGITTNLSRQCHPVIAIL